MSPDSIQTEIDACYLYRKLAAHEKDEALAKIFIQMGDIEQSHAEVFARRANMSAENLIKPSWRAKLLNAIGSVFGYEYVLAVLMDTEKSLSNAIIRTKKSKNIAVTGGETNHVKILKGIIENDKTLSSSQYARFEHRHRSVGGNAIRAAVLGGNDGLVSNFSLVMGIVGATSNQQAVLLAGLAGLLAGALSMAMGEWISVKSSQELYEHQIAIEMDELNTNPEAEEKEIALIYMAKGIPEEQAIKMASITIMDKNTAHEILVKEELGINQDEISGSPIEAALYSFLFFTIGAVVPILPFLFLSGTTAIILSIASSLFGLFLIGAVITLFTGKNLVFSGFRQLLFGLLAATLTYFIGKILGITLLL